MVGTLPVINLSEATFECTFGRGCEGICCRNGRLMAYPEDREAIDGNLTKFQPPGAILTLPLSQAAPYFESLTAPRVLSIDQAGDITGSYTDAAGVQHGFVRNPYGTLTPFDPPESGQTNPTSINDAGVIAGYYFYSRAGGPGVGFIRIP